MVRLKVAEATHVAIVETGFNSKMVRLKATMVVRVIEVINSFNSKMVRLKEGCKRDTHCFG